MLFELSVFGSQNVIHNLASHFSYCTNQSLVLEKCYHMCSYCSFVGRKVAFSKGSFLLSLPTKDQLLRQISALCWATISVQLAAFPYHWSISQQKRYLQFLDIYDNLAKEKRIWSSHTLTALPGDNSMVIMRKQFCCMALVHSDTPVCVHLAGEMLYWNKLCISKSHFSGFIPRFKLSLWGLS